MNTVNTTFKKSPLFVRYKRSNESYHEKSFQRRVTNFKKKSTFLDKLQSIIERNIEDETFGINNLMKEIGYSRSQLHNRIKKLTGVSTSIYIRSIRLNKARQLLEVTDLNISEIAYKVGFKNPSYFSRLFTEKYGISPSRFMIQM